MQPKILQLYPTPMMQGKFDESVVAPVAEELLTKVDFKSGKDITDDNLLDPEYDLPVLRDFFYTHGLPKFKEYTQQCYNYTLDPDLFRFKAWGINGDDQYSLGFHNHSGSQISAVFYILVDDAMKHGGKFRFHDPRFNANRGLLDEFKVQHQDFEVVPETGGFIIFPSYLYHSVTTFHGHMRLLVPVDMFPKSH